MQLTLVRWANDMQNVLPFTISILAKIFNGLRCVTLTARAEGCPQIQTVSLLVVILNWPTLNSAIQPMLLLAVVLFVTVKVWAASRQNHFFVRMSALLIHKLVCVAKDRFKLLLQSRLVTRLRDRILKRLLRSFKAIEIVRLVKFHY